MQSLPGDLPNLIGSAIGLLLSLAVFGYIFFGDNFLFRIAIYVFIGVATGYAAVVAWYSVLWPHLIIPLVIGTPEQRLAVLFPLVLGGLMLLKLSSRLAHYGSPAMGYLVGVGAAAAIGGAILGTLFPQLQATINLFDLSASDGAGVLWRIGSAGTILLGTVTTMIYFQYGTQKGSGQHINRPFYIEWLASVGKFFISVALGAFFAGALLATIAALVERVHFMVDFIRMMITLW